MTLLFTSLAVTAKVLATGFDPVSKQLRATVMLSIAKIAATPDSTDTSDNVRTAELKTWPVTILNALRDPLNKSAWQFELKFWAEPAADGSIKSTSVVADATYLRKQWQKKKRRYLAG